MHPFLFLAACAPQVADPPADGFLKPHEVRVTAPANGDAVGDTFTVTYEAGADVATVRLYANGTGVGPAHRVEASGGAAGDSAADARGGTFTARMSEDGRTRLALLGYDADGVELSRHELVVRVTGAEDVWVTIVTPADGATVPNPVSFVTAASDNVDLVELRVDGSPLGTVAPGDLLTVTIPGTGYPRTVEAVALYDGAEAATDSITLTVDPATEPLDSPFNAAVVAIEATYPTDGSYGYYWPADDGVWFGTPDDVWYLGELLSPADPYHRSYCVGLTWAVLLRALDEIDRSTGGDGSLNGITVDEMAEFRTDWFVRDLYGDGVVTAVENYGVGERVTDMADVRPGDFIQFWRHSGSGHNNIFVDWAYDRDGAIEGVTYWSTQSSTGGIGTHTEYFGTGGASIDPAFFFVARVWGPEDWLPWR